MGIHRRSSQSDPTNLDLVSIRSVCGTTRLPATSMAVRVTTGLTWTLRHGTTMFTLYEETMVLHPIHSTLRLQYPRWGSRLACSMRRVVIVTAGSLIAGAWGCASESFIEPESADDSAIASEARSDAPDRFTEEWVHLPIRIIFEARSYELDDEDNALLREAHAALERRTDVLRVRVEGFVDSTGEPDCGLSLSRA